MYIYTHIRARVHAYTYIHTPAREHTHARARHMYITH